MVRPKLLVKKSPITFRLEDNLWQRVQRKLQLTYGGKDYSRRNLLLTELLEKWLKENQ